MTDKHEMIVGFCWYQPEQWAELKKVAVDPEKLDDTYEEWRANANKAFNEIVAAGHDIRKISINTKELVAWCKKCERQLDGKARSEFAALKLQKRSK